jgi:hypothetical protein
MLFYFRVEPTVENLSQGGVRSWRTTVPELPKEAKLVTIVAHYQAGCPLDGNNTQIWIVDAPNADVLAEFSKASGVTPLSLTDARNLRRILQPITALPVPEPPALPPEVFDLFDDTEKAQLNTISAQLESLQAQVKTGRIQPATM